MALRLAPLLSFHFSLETAFEEGDAVKCVLLSAPLPVATLRDVLCFVFEQEKPTTMYSGMRTP